jgi:preprotein translocase subunit SecB
MHKDTIDMTDTPQQPTNTEENPAPVFAIQKLYVTDISLESPNTPMSFMGSEVEPEFEVQFRNEAKGFDNGFFEASLTVTAKAVAGENTLFLVELTQAGIFQIENIPDEELDPALGIGCPTVLFPYLREAVTDLTTRAGFPPLILQPINFEAIFMQQRQENLSNNQAEKTAEAKTLTQANTETKH